jgi:ribosome-binding factor A
MRQIMGDLLLRRISDPRIDRARTSVTRVEVAEDLLTAKVYISVMGTPGEQNRTIQALRHASGHIQELMTKQMTLRTTPVLNFVLDTEFKKTLETLTLIQKVTDEINQKDRERAEAQRLLDEAAGVEADTETEPLEGGESDTSEGDDEVADADEGDDDDDDR